MACPNINSPQWKALVAKIGTFNAFREFVNNNEQIPDANNYTETLQGVNSTLKVFNALTNPKIEQFFKSQYLKGNKDKFFNEVTALAGKPQTDLLKSLDATNNFSSLNDMIATVLAETNYTIRIDRGMSIDTSDDLSVYDDLQDYYTDLTYREKDDAEPIRPEFRYSVINSEGDSIIRTNSFLEAKNYVEKNNNSQPIESAEYTKLVAPGGTKYMELEIATPQLQPSILGHARFATSNGIGWFRTDDLRIDDNTGKMVSDGAGGLVQLGQITDSTTRRILELQSDLFQKGRDQKILSRDINVNWEVGSQEDWDSSINETTYHIDPTTDEENPYSIRVVGNNVYRRDVTSNGFVYLKGTNPQSNGSDYLQFLNKDANWVSFFIKSIMQDSARRGYSKVLFPNGRTMGVIQGEMDAETLLANIDRNIAALENMLQNPDRYKSGNQYEFNPAFMFDTKEEFLQHVQNSLDNNYRRREQVEGDVNTRLGATKAFYQNQVKRNLEKLYGKDNVLTITDNYNNEWFEVNVTESSNDTIVFQLGSLAADLNVLPTEVDGAIDISSDFDNTANNLEKQKYRETLNTLSQRFGISWQEDNKQQAIGRYENGIVFINMNKIKPDTAFHEFMHPFEQTIKKQNPILWQSLAARSSQVKYNGQSISEYVQRLYPDLAGDDLKSETIVTAIGLAASDPQNISNDDAYKSWQDRFKSFLSKLAEIINNLLGRPGSIKASDISMNASFREVANMLFGNEKQVEVDREALNLQQIFYQKADEAFTRIMDEQGKIRLDQATHKYTYNGAPIEFSVNEKYIKPFYNSIFGDRQKTKLQEEISDITKDSGTNIHKEIEDVLNRYVDPSTGLRRTQPLQAPSTINTNSASYKQIEDYVEQRLALYPDGTRFISEVRIFDAKNNVAGTMDLLVIKPDGKAEILDWKSIQSKNKGLKAEELPWYKEEAYQRQLKAYKDIIERVYNIEVDYAAAIPIQADIKFTIDKRTQKVISHSSPIIRFGDINPRNISQDDNFLLPVVLPAQSTGDEDIDRLVTQLRGIYDKLRNQRLSESGDKKFEKAEKLRSLARAIKDVQTRKDVTALVENGNLMINNILQKLKADTIDEGQIIDYEDMLQFYSNMKDAFVDSLSSDPYFTKEKKAEIASLESNADVLLKRMRKLRAKLAQEMGNEAGVVDITRAERKLDFLKKTFRSLSTLPNATIRTFYNLVVKMQNLRDVKTRNTFAELKTLKDSVGEWAKQRGINPANVFDQILQKDKEGKWTGRFINHYSSEYYKQRVAAIKAKDVNWFANNTVFDQDAFDKALDAYEKQVNTYEYSIDPTINAKIRHERIADYVLKYNPIDEFGALTNAIALNADNYFIKPQAKWESEEWKNLHKKENAPLLAAYLKFQEITAYSKKLGMIEGNTSAFVPNVVASRLDQIAFGNTENLFNVGRMFDRAIVDSTTGFGELDPITGKPKRVVPVYFTSELGEDKSKDLFKVFAVWTAQMYNYEGMKEIEDKARILQRVEEEKKSLVTNRFGKVKINPQTNKPAVEEGPNANAANAKVFEDLMNYYLYGMDTDSESDFTFKFKDKEYSGKKAVKSAVQYMNIKTLSLNVLSATSNLFGGTANAFFTASKRKFFDEKDWVKAGYLLSTRDSKALSMLSSFDIFLEDMKQEIANKLSVSDVVANVTADKLFALQRNTDRAVQYPVFIATALNHMVQDGKIISIKDYVREQNNYEGVYSRSTIAEKKALDSKINKEVEELKQTKSLYATSKIENDRLVIDGLDLEGDEVGKFRALVKKLNKGILGNSTRDDITLARLSMIGQLGLQFRNWMPQMVTERFGDMTYDADLDEYKYGRARLFLKNFASPRMLGLTKELITGFGTNTIERAKERYAEMLNRLIQSGDITDASEFITETEYIDQYISDMRASMRELLLLIAISAFVMWVNPAGQPDDDKKGLYKMTYRGFNKFQDEIGFYYTPQSFTDILKSPIPIVNLLLDTQRFITNTVEQGYGYTLSDEDIQDKAKPLKYLGKIFPISKQAMDWYSALDDDFRKEYGIKL